MRELMDRYIWAAVTLLGMVLASFTVLIVTNHSEEVERFAILAGQAIAAGINVYVVWRATKNTENRVGHKLDEQTEHIDETINGNSGRFPAQRR